MFDFVQFCLVSSTHVKTPKRNIVLYAFMFYGEKHIFHFLSIVYYYSDKY